jgi:hypothetical protein
LGDPGFKSRPGDKLSWVRLKFFFRQVPQANIRIIDVSSQFNFRSLLISLGLPRIINLKKVNSEFIKAIFLIGFLHTSHLMQRNNTLRASDGERHIFWDITPCSPLKVASIFRVEEKAKQETSMKQITSFPEDGGDMFL